MGHAEKIDLIAKKINSLHGEVIRHKKITLDAMIQCGKLLYEEKWKRPGQFLWWLKNNIEFSERTAHKYMRIYSLDKNGLWDKKQSVAENLAFLAEPQTLKQCINQTKAEEVAKEKGIKLTTAKTIVRAMDKIPEVAPVIQIINSLSDISKKKIEIEIKNFAERCHELGRKDKILTMDEKNKFVTKIIKLLESSK